MLFATKTRPTALIIKVSAGRVLELVALGHGKFDFTKTTFKEWVLIGLEYKDE